MPDGNPIIIGLEGNTGSTANSRTRLTRGGTPSTTNPLPFNPMFTIHAMSGGDAIRGESTLNTGAFGISDSFNGVRGNSNSNAGVRGDSGSDTGVIGTGGTPLPPGTPTNGIGVLGIGTASGVSGSSAGGNGVSGSTSSVGGFGVYGTNTSVNKFAIVSDGHLMVINGDKFGCFIDHPLDLENRYLVHTPVESSERKNVYDGIARLDKDGASWVELPEWFEALNGDFRYQLTPVGGSAPGLHVAEEVSENRFKIAGGEEGMKVCWQVTGSRKDRWATANPFEVEREKREEERGRYLDPSLYDAPEEQKALMLQAASTSPTG